MSQFMTAAEVAERWQCSPEHVQRLCQRGELRAMKLGRRGWRIALDAVTEYEARQTTAAPAPTTAPTSREVVTYATSIDGYELPADYTPRFPHLWNGHEAKKKASSAAN